MNKRDMINMLKEKTNYNEEKCIIINDILEDNFIIGRKNKDKIISQLIEKINVTLDEAEEIYNAAMEIVTVSVKDSVKYYFKSKKKPSIPD